MNELKKEIGDLVQINSGANKDKTGTLVEKGKGWVIELTNSKERITVSFPMVTLLQKAQPAAQEAEIEPKTELTELSQIATETVIEDMTHTETTKEAEATENEPESETPPSNTEAGTEEAIGGEAATEITTEELTSGETGSAEPTAETTNTQESTVEINPEIKKLTINQLQTLAKEKKVSIARTKEDFLRIIKQKNPNEDLNLLKGKILFDRVTELKISRLRSKLDLQILLSK